MHTAIYADLMEAVNAGKIVAIAPGVDEAGNPAIAIVTGALEPVHKMYLSSASSVQIACIAIRAVAQVREQYGI
jgi:hypothetical protein